MPGVWAATKGHIGVRGSRSHGGHATWNHGESGLRHRTMSGSVVLSQPRSVLMSMVHVANKDHIGAQGLDQNLWP